MGLPAIIQSTTPDNVARERMMRRARLADPIVGMRDEAIEGYAAMYESAQRCGKVRPGLTFENFLRVAVMLKGRD
jgi:hypothetical protein